MWRKISFPLFRISLYTFLVPFFNFYIFELVFFQLFLLHVIKAMENVEATIKACL
jgi:hypothetical protein